MILQNINILPFYNSIPINIKLITYSYSYINNIPILFILISLVFISDFKTVIIHKVLGLLLNIISVSKKELNNFLSYKNQFCNSNITTKFITAMFITNIVILLLGYLNLFFYSMILILIYKIYNKNFTKWEFSLIKIEHNFISFYILFYITFSILLSLTIILRSLEFLFIPTLSFLGTVIFTKLTFIVYALIILRLIRSYFASISLIDTDKVTYTKHEMLSWVFVMIWLNYTQIYQCDFRFSILITLIIILNYNKASNYMKNLMKYIVNNFKDNKNLILLLPIFSLVKHKYDVQVPVKEDSVIPKWYLNKSDKYSLATKIPDKNKLLDNINNHHKYNITKVNLHEKPKQIISQEYLLGNIKECVEESKTNRKSIIKLKHPTFDPNRNTLEKIVAKHDSYLKLKQYAYDIGTFTSRNTGTIGLPKHFINDTGYRNMLLASNLKKMHYLGKGQAPFMLLEATSEILKQPYQAHINEKLHMHNFGQYKK